MDGNVVRVSNQLKDVPEIRQILDSVNNVQKEIDGVIAQAKGMGIPDNILKIPGSKWLLDKTEAFKIFQEVTTNTTVAIQKRGLFGNFNLDNLKSIRSFVSRNAEARDRLFTGDSAVSKMFENAVRDLRASIMPDATQDEVLDFLLALPSKAETDIKLPKGVSSTLKKAERETLKMNEAVSNLTSISCL